MDLQWADDLVITSGGDVTRETDESVLLRQRARIAFGIARGEWFLDTSFGFPWLLILGMKNFSKQRQTLTALTRAVAIAVPGITAVNTVDATQTARSMTLRITANGNVAIETEVPTWA